MIETVTKTELVRRLREEAENATEANYHEYSSSLHTLAKAVDEVPATEINWFAFTEFDGEVLQFIVGAEE